MPTPDFTRTRFARLAQSLIKVSIDWNHLRDAGTWQSKSGGNMTSTSTKIKPGGMSPQVSIGGTKDIQNITLRRPYQLGFDDQYLDEYYAAAGRAPASVTVVSVDDDGNPNGVARTFRGVFIRVNPPEWDATSDEAAMIEIELDLEGSLS